MSRVQISVMTIFFFFFFCDFFLFIYLFILSLLLQCKFANSTLLSLLSFSNFITHYDAQASSAFSALIQEGQLSVTGESMCTKYWLSLPRKSVVRLTDRPDMTLDVYRGRKTTIQQQQHNSTLC